jgi:tetratricopeptide (TPR) repeat protein
MGKAQWILLSVGVVMVAVIYLTLDSRPPEAYEYEESRVFQMQSTSARNLIREKLPQLDEESQMRIRSINVSIENSQSLADSVERIKELSGAWYKQEEPVLAGYYAEQVATLEGTAPSWSMAGTTYALALHKENMAPKERDFAADQARSAFEKAITLEPENVDHRINLALTYVQAPLENQPMKGIQMLLELNRKHPDNASVLYHLGRLAIQTGQYERAIERLERVLVLQPNRKNAHCLLADAYASTQQMKKAEASRQACQINN